MDRIGKSADYFRTRAAYAGAVSRGADAAEVSRLRLAFEAARTEDAVRRAVSAAPKLTDADRANLVSIVLGADPARTKPRRTAEAS